MCSQEVDLTNLDLGLLQIENDDQSKIDQIKTCSTEEDLETLKQMCGDWIAGCGVPTVYTANLQDLPRVLNRVVAHFIFHRSNYFFETVILSSPARPTSAPCQPVALTSPVGRRARFHGDTGLVMECFLMRNPVCCPEPRALTLHK
ncbi:unnamed protein product [Arctogadus glacialis]